MLSAILFVGLSVLLSGASAVTCPSGYKNLYADHCYKLYTNGGANYETTKNICQNDGAMPVSIHNTDENRAVQSECSNNGIGYIWLGLECQSDGSKAWIDGTPFDFDYTSSGGAACDQSLGFQMQVSGGTWFAYRLDDAGVWPFCKISGTSVITTSAPPTSAAYPSGGTECGSDYSLLEIAGTCVRIDTTPSTWNDAESSCQNDGAHLASIHSKKENDFIRRQAVGNRLLNGLLIGIKLSDGDPSWSDSSDLDYTNFDSGMPNQLFGLCGSMDTRTLEAEWTSIYCDARNTLPFVCSKPKPCPAQNTYTVSGSLQSPEYPYSNTRGLSCEYFVAASEGSKVQLKFDEFQLVDGDALLLFEGVSADTPFAIITSATNEDRFHTEAGSVLRIVHETGSGSGTRFWSASFASF